MSFKALVYAYVLGGITFIPLVLLALIAFSLYTAVPVGDPDAEKRERGRLESKGATTEDDNPEDASLAKPAVATSNLDDIPRPRKGWLTVRRTFEESNIEGSYVQIVRSYLDSKSKDPKRSRPRDMWYTALKGKVLYLYEDESMNECEAAIELSGHDVVVYPEGLTDGELFAKRNAICLKPKIPPPEKSMPSVTKEMKLGDEDIEEQMETASGNSKKREKEKEKLAEEEAVRDMAREQALDPSTPWFIFVRSNVEMEDWYFALVHASDHAANSPTLIPLQPVFQPDDMGHLVATLDEQPDVIPMRWLNALIGRIFFAYYRTKTLEQYIIGRLMKKLSKVKRPAFLTNVEVTEVSVGNRAPTFSKPMLKELTKEGDAALEVRVHYRGEFRITIKATATINLGSRFKSYTVELVLAAVLRELDGNMLVKVKRPPSNRIWYAFTQMPRMVLDVEPIVSDRQITWGMILSTIESRLKEIIQESVVMPNMDDIAFFESSPYQHRGGIWADASRYSDWNEKPAEDPDEGDSTASTPVPESTPAQDVQVDPASLHRSQSAEDHSPPMESIEKLLHRDHDNPTRQEGATSAESTDANRRRASASSQKQSDRLDGSSAEDTAEQESAVDRGMTAEMDVPARPRSAPADQEGSQSRSDSPEPSPPLSVSTRRSQSQHSHASSLKEEAGSSMRDASLAESPFDSDVFSPPKPYNSARGSTNNSSTASSILATIKSRAGDKQALSNTAKEAMRKWGVNVNWGSPRSQGGEEGDAFSDDASGSSNRAQKARNTYADMRAAVERRGRTSSIGSLFGGGSGSSPSDPINIPGDGGGRDPNLSRSAPGAQQDNNKVGSPSPERSSGPPPTSSPEQRPKRMSTGSSRSTTEVHGPDHASTSRVSNEEEAPRGAHSPIHTQPSQARTMTIPGIHASHRGEVMSMGYVPPSSAEGRGRGQGIVSRLLKSPILSAQQQQQQQQGQGQGHPSASEPAISDHGGGSGGSPPLRVAPPPLPPRALSTTVSRNEVPGAAGTVQGSSASDALRSIARMDSSGQRSSSVEGVNGSGLLQAEGAGDAGGGDAGERGKPPLPPRRSQAIS